jgi:hypothetical protein
MRARHLKPALARCDDESESWCQKYAWWAASASSSVEALTEGRARQAGA